MPIFNNALAGAAGSTGGAAAPSQTRSLRFNSADSAYLNRTPSSAGNRKTWTWSGWVKLTDMSTSQSFLFGAAGGFQIYFANNKIFLDGDGNVNAGNYWTLVTTRVFRDPAAWYHFVFVHDTTQSAANDRFKIYVNGVQLTDFDTNNRTNLTQNSEGHVNNNVEHRIGRQPGTSVYANFYLAENQCVDGQSLAATDFGEYDSNNNWNPKAYSGSYGTNGFYLKFADNSSNSALGNDSSGNNNDWSVNNLTATVGTVYSATSSGMSNPGLMFDGDTSTSPSLTADGTVYTMLTGVSIACSSSLRINANANNFQVSVNGGSYTSAASVNSTYLSLSVPSGNTLTSLTFKDGAGGGYGVRALEVDGTVLVDGDPTSIDSLIDTPTNYTADSGNNGGNYATLNPLDGTPSGLSNGNLDATSANAYPTIIPGSGQWYYEVNGTGYDWDGTRANFTPRAGSHNFGQRPFSGTPTTGHVSVCTQNLANPTIADGSTVFDVATDTGANILSSTKALCSGNVDFLWIKDRPNETTNHYLIDIVRDSQLDGTPFLSSNTTSSESTNGTYSAPSGNSVGWGWDAGSSTVSNTTGDLDSFVRANTSAGFSIVKYTSDQGNTNDTVGHNLNAVPDLILLKRMDGTDPFVVYHNVLSTPGYLELNNPSSTPGTASCFPSDPTSSVFTIGTDGRVNAGGNSYIAYLWTSIPGFSSFGSYSGNGSTDGPCVMTSFRPALVIARRSSGQGDWIMQDTTRTPFNGSGDNNTLVANNDEDEDGYYTAGQVSIDYLSNGFKLRHSGGPLNDSGQTYLYAAWAEHPFKTSRAR